MARQEVTRLDQIITQFLRALRPAPVKVATAHLGEILKQTLEFMKQEIENRGINVHISIPDDLPAALADTDQMRQAFFNLIKNAVQAMPDGGRLELNLTPPTGLSPSPLKIPAPVFRASVSGRCLNRSSPQKAKGPVSA